jgi:pimeloyl-ACP methyl ester carboxylesterase
MLWEGYALNADCHTRIAGVISNIWRRVVSGTPTGPTRIAFRSSGAAATIAFVHGFGGDAKATWGEFPQFLTTKALLKGWDIYSLGYPTSLRVDIPSLWAADPDLDALAMELITVLTHPPFDAYRSLALVAHSMGGLIVQKALLNQELAKRVSHVVLFGTPSEGLNKASLASILKRQSRDMSAGGAFITELRQSWQQIYASGTPFRFRTVAGDRDEFVPRISSLEPFPHDARAVVPGNHIEIVKPSSAEGLSVMIVEELLLPKRALRGSIDSARLAVEERRFADAIAVLYPRADALDEPALVQLSLALESVGRRSDALELLERRYRRGVPSLDALGVLAGRLKRRWLAERDELDWKRARSLYLDALAKAEDLRDADQAMYHAVNVAFLDLMITPPNSKVPAAVTAMVTRALAHSSSAREGHWQLATEGEALAILGNLDEALSRYRAAIASRPEPRAIESMYMQASRVIGHVCGEDGQERLAAIFGPSLASAG